MPSEAAPQDLWNMPPALPAPPPPVRPVMHSYTWPDVPSNPEAVYFVATRDGFVRSAIAVCVEDGAVAMVTSDHKSETISLDSIDRDLTRKLNEPTGMKLWLPPSRR